MVAVSKVDSNDTELRIAEEETYKVLPSTPIWDPLEPNSYTDFGGQVTTVSRTPIRGNRQRRKGVVTDLDASGGFDTDLTQTNLQKVLQGVFFADLRRKGEEIVTAVDIDTTNPDEYQVAATAGFLVGSLIQGQNFLLAANNAVNEVVAVVTDVSVEVIDGVLLDEASPPADAQIVVIGHVADSADIDVDATGTYPALTSTALDFTTLGLIPGEWIFIGGDPATSDFVAAANNGFKRIFSIAALRLEFDKSDLTMTTETGTAILLQMFFGRVLKNELGALITRRSYQLERQLGAPDDAQPAQIQAEYLVGQVPSELAMKVPSADKIMVDLSFMGADHETIDGPTALKTGTRPALVESDAFNTSSDFSRIRMAIYTAGTEAPTPLFAFAQELTVTISNNLSRNKAVATLGAFDITAGIFQVGGSVTAYFADLASVDAIRSNDDVTIDLAVVKGAAGAKQGIVLDLPLLTLGDGRLNVVQDQPITIPLAMDAVTAVKLHADLDYTALMVFFDHLPNAADV